MAPPGATGDQDAVLRLQVKYSQGVTKRYLSAVVYEANARGGGELRSLSQWEPLYTGAQIT
jgi:hypothetical protein